MEFNGTFLIATISFIIFTLLMNKILYKPINDIIEKRNMLLDDNKTKVNTHNQNEKELINTILTYKRQIKTLMILF